MRRIVKLSVLTIAIAGAQMAMMGFSIFTLLSALLTAGTLVLVRDGLAVLSRLIGFLTIACLYWGLSYASNLMEALYFAVIPLKSAVFAAGAGFMMALAVAGLLEVLSLPVDGGFVRGTARKSGIGWRIPLLVLAFFATYLAAGIAIYPWVAGFYAGRPLPTLSHLFYLQLCRGTFDLACIYPVYWQWKKSRNAALIMSACVFTILCGWGPLLLPNQFMPGHIRLAHAAEMGASGIVFGMLTAAVLLSPIHRMREEGMEVKQQG